MREIKYRAWDKKTKKIADVLCIDWLNNLVDLTFSRIERGFSEVKLMQFTGLKDKNGVDIYEGDILKISNTKRFLGRNYKCYSDIEIIGGHVYVWTDPVIDGQRVRYGAKMLLDGLAKYIDMRGVATSDVEVVGNIYEDKELLRSEAE